MLRNKGYQQKVKRNKSRMNLSQYMFTKTSD